VEKDCCIFIDILLAIVSGMRTLSLLIFSDGIVLRSSNKVVKNYTIKFKKIAMPLAVIIGHTSIIKRKVSLWGREPVQVTGRD
jgi:uncharacterized membrane protein YbjE (DUF340 family)